MLRIVHALSDRTSSRQMSLPVVCQHDKVMDQDTYPHISNWSEVGQLYSEHAIRYSQYVLQIATVFLLEKVQDLLSILKEKEIDLFLIRNSLVFLAAVLILCKCFCVINRILQLDRKRSILNTGKELNNCSDVNGDLTTSWSVFDLAKTAYEPGHSQTVINIIEKLHYDVNSVIPSNGLTLFLCACLSGQKGLIKYMLAKGADVRRTTKAGDTALYLATFGILSTNEPDVTILEDLIHAGCNVNTPNLAGYTPLHRAAGHGNLHVIQTLLKNGADPYQASCTGIYPIDSAINAGNLDAADLLKIHIPNPHVWDVVEPHTPPHIKLGLQSPQRKHLIESTRRIMSPRIM